MFYPAWGISSNWLLWLELVKFTVCWSRQRQAVELQSWRDQPQWWQAVELQSWRDQPQWWVIAVLHFVLIFFWLQNHANAAITIPAMAHHHFKACNFNIAGVGLWDCCHLPTLHMLQLVYVRNACHRFWSIVKISYHASVVSWLL